MRTIKNKINRRNFLRSSAAGLTSASMVNAFVERALAADTKFKRCIIWYVPEGCAQQAFWPQETGNLNINMNASLIGGGWPDNWNGTEGRLSNRETRIPSMAGYCLQPMKKHEADISLYGGFINKKNDLNGVKGTDTAAGAPHTEASQTALTGGRVAQGSFDQVVGPQIKGDSPISSIYTAVYGHHVANAGTSKDFMSPFRQIGGGRSDVGWNPMKTYNQLFSNGIPKPDVSPNPGSTAYDPNLSARVEILKQATSRLNQVKCKGGDQARLKLEAYVDSFERLEQQAKDLIDANNTGVSADVSFDIPAGWQNFSSSLTDKSKYWNQPQNFQKMVDIAIDTTVAALALDRTRMSLLQFSATTASVGPASGDHYKHCGIAGLEGGTQDHSLGHDNNAVKRRDQARIFRWYYSKLSYLLDRLKEIPDGNGTLFDSTLIITATDYGAYNHQQWDCPYMTCGSLGGILKTGQYTDAADLSLLDGQPQDRRRTVIRENMMFKDTADIFLSYAHALGVNLDHFGVSTTPYNGIFVDDKNPFS